MTASIEQSLPPIVKSAKQFASRFLGCYLLAQSSTCPRRKFGAIILNPENNTILSDGYNGPPRGAESLCGGHCCDREAQNITSGTSLEIGCHHAEMNAILNATRNGISTQGAWLMVTGEPCLMCAKAIHHAGIESVFYIEGQYTEHNGIDYLKKHGVNCFPVKTTN